MQNLVTQNPNNDQMLNIIFNGKQEQPLLNSGISLIKQQLLQQTQQQSSNSGSIQEYNLYNPFSLYRGSTNIEETQFKIEDTDQQNYFSNSNTNESILSKFYEDDKFQNMEIQQKRIRKRQLPSKQYIKLDHRVSTCPNCIKLGLKKQQLCVVYQQKLRNRRKQNAAEQRDKFKDQFSYLSTKLQEFKLIINGQKYELNQYQNKAQLLREKLRKQQQELQRHADKGKELLNIQLGL